MKKRIPQVLFLFSLLLSISSLLAQQFKPDERSQLFDADWKFALGDFSDAKNFSFNDGNWRKLDLPHDWSIEGSVDKDNPTGGDGGYFPAGIGWYRKKFNVPAGWQDKSVSIYFEGVYMNSEVFVNGNLVGKRPYEIIERTKPEVVKTGKMLVDHVKKFDITRPVTSAMTTWNQGWEVFDSLFAVHDVGGYNYQLHRALSDHKRVPSRIMVQTESYPREAFINWERVDDDDHIIDDFVWTAMDYLGESGIGRYFYPDEPKGEHYEDDLFPWNGAYCGDIDLTGWRKPIAHYRNLLWNENEKLYMAVKEPNPDEGKIRETMWSVWPTWESWIWPGNQGKEIEVEIYSKYPSVKLYLNNKLIGEKHKTIEQQHKAIFKVDYISGTLKAVGIQNGKETVPVVLKTAGEARTIKLNTDRTMIKANGQDLSFATVEIFDENGTKQPNAENELTFNIDGPGGIAAVGNANLKDTDTYVSNKRNAWKGRALVVIKSNKTAGNIRLTVSSPGLKSASMVIRSVK